VQSAEALTKSFRELIIDKPYRDVTVVDICRNANVSRRQFYICFKDKLDVFEKVIDEDFLMPARDLDKMLSSSLLKSSPYFLTERIYHIFIDNHDFYERLIAYPDSRLLFIETATECLMRLNNKLLSDLFVDKGELEYVSYFISSSHVMLWVKWIRDDMTPSPQEMAQLFNKYALSALRKTKNTR